MLKTVAVCSSEGKTPVVVNDCPGFLVEPRLVCGLPSRVSLLHDARRCWFSSGDKTMEKLSWPMGPCLLIDVGWMYRHRIPCRSRWWQNGFSDRMKHWKGKKCCWSVCSRAWAFWPTWASLYSYEPDRRGKPKKSVQWRNQCFVGPCLFIAQSEWPKKTYWLVFDEFALHVEDCRCVRRNFCVQQRKADIGWYMYWFPSIYSWRCMHVT